MDTRRVQDQAIYTKIYDLTLWLFPHVAKFPKHERGGLALSIKQCDLELLRYVVLAYNSRMNKARFLESASAELDLLRLLIRMSVDLRYTSIKQYQFASELVNEVGRMLGGWISSQGKRAT